ncbi:MAG: type II secretion system protein [Oscillospiraceae bacterium]|nr:type II secretion system protein [Oscillospiraceae bacterium]
MKKFMENSIKRVMGNKKNANKKKLKGFTLVEIIVVLVILAILAAAMIPALTGYIDKANEKTAISEARNVVTAAQTIVSEAYALGDLDKMGTADETSGDITISDTKFSEILSLADITDSKAKITKLVVSSKGKIKELAYTTTKETKVTYSSGSFTIGETPTTTTT